MHMLRRARCRPCLTHHQVTATSHLRTSSITRHRTSTRRLRRRRTTKVTSVRWPTVKPLWPRHLLQEQYLPGGMLSPARMARTRATVTSPCWRFSMADSNAQAEASVCSQFSIPPAQICTPGVRAGARPRTAERRRDRSRPRSSLSCHLRAKGHPGCMHWLLSEHGALLWSPLVDGNHSSRPQLTIRHAQPVSAIHRGIHVLTCTVDCTSIAYATCEAGSSKCSF